MALRNMNGGQSAPLLAYNAETIDTSKGYNTGIIVMPIVDGDIVGVLLDNHKNGSTTEVTIPSQPAGVWSPNVFYSVSSPSGALVSRIAGLKNVESL